jgi:hypothetical protein
MSGTVTTTTAEATITVTTTVITFAPSATASPPFSFQFTVSGVSYNGQCTFNVARQDWYLQILDSNNNLLINHPLVSSLVTAPQNLAPGIFTNATISYNAANAQITITETDSVETFPANPIPFLELST